MLSDIHPGRLERFADELGEALGTRIPRVLCDVRSNEAVVRLIARAEAEFDGLDVLVNKAGLGLIGLAYVDQAYRSKSLDELLAASPTVLRGVAQSQADVLRSLGVGTVAELAAFAAAEEAEAIVTGAPSEDDDPFAPACVLPTCKKFTKSLMDMSEIFNSRNFGPFRGHFLMTKKSAINFPVVDFLNPLLE